MSNQRTFMKMKMMRTVRIIGEMSTQRRRAAMEMKIPEALMHPAASARRKAAAADECGASTLRMYTRSLATTAPMTWIQTDVRLYHRLVKALGLQCHLLW